MPLLEQIADDLATKTLAEIDESGDDRLAGRVSEALGATSPTLQESFDTAIRIRRAEARGLAVLAAARSG